MAEERSQPLKLNRNNYYVWTKIAKSDLCEKGCWDAVKPGFVDDSGKNLEKLSAPQSEKNDRAIAYIFKSVEHYYLEDIGECETAKEAWEVLEQINTDFSILHTLMHLKEMVNMKKDPMEPMQDYLGKITALNRKCAKAKLKFDDRAVAYFYLLGLPKEYEGLTRSLERDEDSLNPKDVRAKLLAEERRLERGGGHRGEESDDFESDAARAYAARKYSIRGGHPRSHSSRQHPYRPPSPYEPPSEHRHQLYRPPSPYEPPFVQRRHQQPWKGGKHVGPASRDFGGDRSGGRGAHGERKWQRSPNPTTPTSSSRDYRCYSCGNLGHRARECPDEQSRKVKCENNKPARKPIARVAVAVRGESESDSESASDPGVGGDECVIAPSVEREKVSDPGVESDGECVIAPGFDFEDAVIALMCVGTSGTYDPDDWYLDSGASDHMCPDAGKFTGVRDVIGRKVRMGDGDRAPVRGKGGVEIKLSTAHGGRKLGLSEVLYVPDLDGNLLSVGKLTDKGVKLTFEKDTAIARLGGEEIFTAKKIGGIYVVKALSVPTHREGEQIFLGISLNAIAEKQTESISPDGGIWHRRLGHINSKYMERIPGLSGIEYEGETCASCIEGKSVRKGFNNTDDSRAPRVLELTHSDVMGKFEPASIGGARYALTLLDDYSRFATVRFMKTKDEVPAHILQYRKLNENKLQTKMVRLKTDNGGEYIGRAFEDELKNCGILHLKSCPRCPELNGRSERLNRSIMEMARCMMMESGTPKFLWAEAVNTACYIKNRCPTRSLDFQIPLTLWENRALTPGDLNKLRVFGCRVWTHVENGSKLDARAEECVFLGYEEETKNGIRVYSLKRGRISVRNNGIFEENIFPFKLRREGGKINHTEAAINPGHSSPEHLKPITISNDEITTDSPTRTEGHTSRKSDGTADRESGDNPTNVGEVMDKILNSRNELTLNDILALERDHLSDPNHTRESPIIPNGDLECKISTVECGASVEPKNVNEALRGPHRQKWLEAMNVEMRQIRGQEVWELVPRPYGKNVIGCKWVLTMKRGIDGYGSKFKARLVAMGCAQKFGVDYEETFSPVVRKETIRVMLALTCEMGWATRHVDVTSAYLNSELHETIYMRQPQYFVERGKEEYVCRLKKSLYGLKQSGKEWYDTVDQMLQGLGLLNSQYDQCLYFNKERDLFVTVYVDDFGVWGEENLVRWFVSELSRSVQVKDMGEVSNLLNLNIKRIDRYTITVDQCSEIEALLKEHNMLHCNGHYTPLNIDIFEVIKSGGRGAERCDELMYRRAIGNLLYLANCTRPDLSFAVSFLGQFCNKPLQGHWLGIKHLLKYLKQTKDLCLTFSRRGEPIQSYCDSDYSQNKFDRKSFSGLAIMFGNCAVIWSCRKQSNVSMSTVVAEYVSLSAAVPEVIWLTDLMHELKHGEFAPRPATIMMDNNGAICVAKNRSIARRTKCIDIRHHFLRDEFRKGKVQFAHVRSNENVADILTKSLSPVKTKGFLKKLGLMNV